MSFSFHFPLHTHSLLSSPATHTLSSPATRVHGRSSVDFATVVAPIAIRSSVDFATVVASIVILTEIVTSVDFASRSFRVLSGSTAVEADAVVVATGAVVRRLRFPGFDRYWNRGISACAVCDGAAPIFCNRPITVVGGATPIFSYYPHHQRHLELFVTY